MSHLSLNEWLQKLNQEKIDYGLERIHDVYACLKLSSKLPLVMTIGGTNGKGSTSAIVSSLAQQTGAKVGMYTSPHLIQYNERIKINDIPVSDETIVKAFERIDEVRHKTELSYFEFSTLAALIIFVEASVDLIVLEVGLGGRLDATNVVDTDCAIITTVDIDHSSILGNDKESIAREKAGIIRSGKPTVYGDYVCPKAILKTVDALDSELLLLERDYKLEVADSGFHYSFQKIAVTVNQMCLKGVWQYKNAAAAITALIATGFDLKEKHIQTGLQRIKLNGRLEVVNLQPQVILDVAHNLQSAQVLSQWLDDNKIEGKTRAVFSVLLDKQLADWIGFLTDSVDHWYISEIKGSSRAMTKSDLLMVLSERVKLISAFDDIQSAYQQAVENSDLNDRVIVFGSFYTLSEVYICLNN